jgi:hypothetical protein
MYAPVFSVCSASAPVTALIGTSPVRLYLFGEAPQRTAKPYAVWQTISGSPENFINQTPDVDSYLLQIDVYADSASSARAVAAVLRDALEPVAHITRWGGESIDPDTNARRYSFDVSWIVQRIPVGPYLDGVYEYGVFV